MNQKTTSTDETREERRAWPDGFDMAAWCGSVMDGKGCPCGSILRRHRAAVYSALAGVGLTFLLLWAGWILGIVAFFRTF